MLGKCLETVRKAAPIVHSITNYVTVNDVANLMLACGASPIMADEPEEAAEITSISAGLYINLGTLNKSSIRAMFTAGARARELEKIILLDPVGAGASVLRTSTAAELIERIKPNIIRGNMSEIKAIFYGSGTTRGVDADIADTVTEEGLDAAVSLAKELSAKSGAIIVITGKIDLAAAPDKCFVMRNGVPEMSRITGTGCMLSGLTAAYAATNKEDILTASAAAVCLMGLAGETGKAAMTAGDGNAALRSRIIDAVYNIGAEALDGGARYEIR